MNFYQETPEDRERKKAALEEQIKNAVKKEKTSAKEWLVKPIVVAILTAAITTSISVPLTIYVTKVTNGLLDSTEQQIKK